MRSERLKCLKNSVFKWPSLLALSHIGLLEYIPQAKATMAVQFTSRKVLGRLGLECNNREGPAFLCPKLLSLFYPAILDPFCA